MKNKNQLLTLTLVFMGAMSLLIANCSKKTDPAPASVTITPGTSIIDTSYTHDLVHGNVMWASRYYDFSNTLLTGRFNNYNFAAKPGDPTFKKTSFVYNEPDPSKSYLNFWVQLSTYNTGQPGRDGLGKCGLGNLGIVYLDSSKTKVDPLSDTARFISTSFVQTGPNDYDVKGNFTFNRYRGVDGKVDGTPITKPVTVHLVFNGQKDFDSNNDGTMDKLRAGFTATFSFNRSDYMDKTSTKAFYPVPAAADVAGNAIAVNNKTYGVWSASTADKMDITANIEFYKNH